MKNTRGLVRLTGLVVASLALAGCGGGSGATSTTKKSTAGTTAPGSAAAPTTPTTPPTTSTPAPTGFEVTSFSPKTGPASTASLTIAFSQPVDPASLTFSSTWIAAEDDDTTPGGTYHALQGTLALDAPGTVATFTPLTPFHDGQEVRFLLSTGVLSTKGDPLATGSVSEALAFKAAFKNEIFEAKFMPSGGTGTPSGPAVSGIPAITIAPTTPPPGPSVAGAFEVVRTTPTANAVEPTPTSIFVEFSSPIDRTTLKGGTGATIGLIQATSSPTTFSFPKFAVRFDQNDTRLEIVPQPTFDAGRDLFLLLSSNLKDTSGKSLSQGAASSALTKGTWLSKLVFELKITPLKVKGPTAPADPSVFVLQSGTDPWFLDFDARAAQFAGDLQKHGLASGDPATDALAAARVKAGVLSTVSVKYGRTADGKGQSGAWKISFTAQRPAGTPGRDFSRMVFGGLPPSAGTLGQAILDAGNKGAEDNAGSSQGIFTSVINGLDSKLDPVLSAADRKFLDGSYQTGTSGADDARQARVLAVIDDWSRAVGCVASHEIGHSVGLSHLDSNLSIMDSASTSSQLSDPRTQFIQQSVTLLDQNLGRQ